MVPSDIRAAIHPSSYRNHSSASAPKSIPNPLPSMHYTKEALYSRGCNERQKEEEELRTVRRGRDWTTGCLSLI